MTNTTLPLNIPDLIIGSLHLVYISISTTFLCLASYVPTCLSITLYPALFNYLCPLPQPDDFDCGVLRLASYLLTIICHFSLLAVFASPDGNPRYLAPSVAWACAWTASLCLVVTTTVFIVALLVLKPLQMLGYLPTLETAQPWIYDSSRQEKTGGISGKAPIVRLEMKDGVCFADTCEHVTNEAVLTIKSLCKDLRAGRTLAIYRSDTEGMRNEDFIGFFHLFRLREGIRETFKEKER